MDSLLERRRAGRIPCRLPVRLLRSGHVTHGMTEDLSRTGVRIRVPLKPLGLEPSADIGHIAKRIAMVLGDSFVAEFHYEMLGNLVRKVLRVARLAHPDRHDGTIDIGCELRVPLDDEETKVLGITLPAMVSMGVESLSPATRDVADGNAHGRRTLTAFLSPAQEKKRQPLRARAEGVTVDGLCISLPELERAGLVPTTGDPTSVLVAFDEVYGSELGLLLVDGSEPIWSGVIRVDEVEARRGTEPPRLHLGFCAPLSPSEMLWLGLV